MSVDTVLPVALAGSLVANALAAVEVLHSIRYCFRRRVFWRVTPAELTAAGLGHLLRPTMVVSWSGGVMLGDHGCGPGSAPGSPTGPGTARDFPGAYCDACGATAYGSDEQIKTFAAHHVCSAPQ